jgi:plasmid stabilization system protein ParE
VRIEVLEVARREFDEAFLYYERQRAGLGEEFRAEIRALVMKIRDFPDAWTLVRPGIRKCLGQRFPYDVIYQKSGDLLLVLALAHRRRRPRYWEDRLSDA